MRTAGRTILLTGASRGLGALMARDQRESVSPTGEGARSEAALVSLARELAARGATAVPIVADVSVETDRVRLVAEAGRVLGRIDVLLNNAGVESGAAFATPLNDSATLWPVPVMRRARELPLDHPARFTIS